MAAVYGFGFVLVFGLIFPTVLGLLARHEHNRKED